MWEIPNWPNKWQIWDDNSLKLLLLEKMDETDLIKVPEIVENSERFPINFPTETPRCKYLGDKVSEEVLERNINSVYPVIHEKALYLCAQFLLFKKVKGTAKEQALYKDMSLANFIEQLLTKKAIAFLGVADHYRLLDGNEGYGGWDLVGTNKETEELNIAKCLSYDEMKLSALLSISSYTYFLNDGNRKNCAKWQSERENIEDQGIIIGLIGTRLVKENAMEFEEILATKNQNTKKNGYGVKDTFKHLIAKFYEEDGLTFDAVVKKAKKDEKRFLNESNVYFDNVMYAKRMSLSFDTLLLEANERARHVDKSAFVHVVGLGLGVWRAFSHQRELFLDIFIKRIEFLGKNLSHISDVFFDYFSADSVAAGFKHNDKIRIEDHPFGGISVYFGKRNPHEKLVQENEGKLLVVSYAADSNSMPGNEFWLGCLSNSSDSAAASSTQISELHNPFLNKKVSVGNLRVAAMDGVFHIQKYIEKIISEQKMR